MQVHCALLLAFHYWCTVCSVCSTRIQ